MDDYISREAAIALLKKWADGYDYIETPTEDAINEFNAIPAADVRPVVRGEWVWDENGMDWNIGVWRCSCCGSRPATFWNTIHDNPFKFAGSKFCDNCGADMRPKPPEREADEEDEP